MTLFFCKSAISLGDVSNPITSVSFIKERVCSLSMDIDVLFFTGTGG